jgi:hypothetical protein
MVGDDSTLPPLTGVGRLEVAMGVAAVAFAAVRFFSSDQVRSSFCRMNLPLFSLRFMIMNSQWLTLRRSSKYSTDQWYLSRQYASRHVVIRAHSPLHEEDPRHQAMRDQDADAGEVLVAELSPQTLVEATNSVVCVCSALTVGYAVEEVAVVGSLLPHALHFGGAWLEVAKVLLAQAGLLEDLDLVAGEGRGRGVVRGQGAQDALGGLACPAVGRGEELDRVIGLEQRAKLSPCIFGLVVDGQYALISTMSVHGGAYLGDTVRGQLHTVVGDKLVDVAVLVALGLRVADQDDHLDRRQLGRIRSGLHKHTRGFPILGAGARGGRGCEGFRGGVVYAHGRV